MTTDNTCKECGKEKEPKSPCCKASMTYGRTTQEARCLSCDKYYPVPEHCICEPIYSEEKKGCACKGDGFRLHSATHCCNGNNHDCEARPKPDVTKCKRCGSELVLGFHFKPDPTMKVEDGIRFEKGTCQPPTHEGWEERFNEQFCTDLVCDSCWEKPCGYHTTGCRGTTDTKVMILHGRKQEVVNELKSFIRQEKSASRLKAIEDAREAVRFCLTPLDSEENIGLNMALSALDKLKKKV